MPNTVASNCLTSLVEDIDDDNDNWWDTNETACQTNPLSSSSIPVDTDGDWICNYIDTDDDNDGWSDADETMCEPRNAWSSFATGQSGTSNTHVAYNHPTDLIFDDYGLRMAGTGPSSGYPTLWSYTDPAVIGNNPDYTHLGSPGHWSPTPGGASLASWNCTMVMPTHRRLTWSTRLKSHRHRLLQHLIINSFPA